MGRIAVVALAVVAAGCGAGGTDEVDVPQPSAACADAFSAAVPERDVIDVPEDEERLATTALDRLTPTLQDCASLEDWLAGARDYPETLPAQMDRLTALRLLCEDDREPSACEELLMAPQEPGD